MTGYTKLFSTIVTSTIWQEDLPTKVLWITLLALSDSDGMVEGAIPGIARIAGVSLEECERSLAKLQQPDKYSRTPDHDGRRIEVVEGGWFILNRGKYRDKDWQQEKLERHREANRRYYERQRNQNSDHSDNPVSESDRIGDKKEKEKEKIKTSLSELENSSDQERIQNDSQLEENATSKSTPLGVGESSRATPKPRVTPTPSHEAEKLAALLGGEIRKNAPDYRITPGTQRKWAVIADLMLRRDGRSYDRIAEIIRWCQADEFWHSNILSMGKVREKFNQLELRRGQRSGNSHTPVPPKPMDYTLTQEEAAMRAGLEAARRGGSTTLT